MPPTCQTCQRPDVKEINGLLLAGISLRNIAKQFDIPDHTALFRHKENCIQSLFADKRDETRAGLLKDVDELKQEILDCKADFGDNPTARVQLIARRKEAIELEAKLTGAFINAATNPADTEAFIKATAREMWLNSGPFSDNEQRDHYAKRISEKTGIDPLKEFGEPVEWVN